MQPLADVTTGWHIAAAADRASIEAGGLLPRHPDGTSAAEVVANVVGVYCMLDDPRDDALGFYEYERGVGDDLWRVDLSGVEVFEDAASLGQSVVCLQAITPEALTLVERAEDYAAAHGA